MSYEHFIILRDEPSDAPRLGFAEYAQSFTEIIANSPPHFAIGIFGDWGSGKTTLMRAIETRVSRSDDMLPVWFNAWRYEREEHLVVPLLDNLRESLLRLNPQESSILMDLLQRDAKDLGNLNAETLPLGQWVERTSAHVERINAALLETRLGRRASAPRASEAVFGMGGKVERLQPRPASPDLFSDMTSSPNDPTRTPRSPAHDGTRDDATAATVVTYGVVLKGSPAEAAGGHWASRNVQPPQAS